MCTWRAVLRAVSCGVLLVKSLHIGDVRRFLFVPWTSRWNAIVRDVTASLEKRGWFHQ